jgi:hypothetical protein
MNNEDRISDLEQMIIELTDELEEEFGKVGEELQNKRPWSLIIKARKLVPINEK